MNSTEHPTGKIRCDDTSADGERERAPHNMYLVAIIKLCHAHPASFNLCTFLCPILHFRRLTQGIACSVLKWDQNSFILSQETIEMSFLPFSCSHSLTSISKLASFVFILIMHVAMGRDSNSQIFVPFWRPHIGTVFFMDRFSFFPTSTLLKIAQRKRDVTGAAATPTTFIL